MADAQKVLCGHEVHQTGVGVRCEVLPVVPGNILRAHQELLQVLQEKLKVLAALGVQRNPEREWIHYL